MNKQKVDVLFVDPPKTNKGRDYVLNTSLLWLASYIRKNDFKTKIIALDQPGYQRKLNSALKKYDPAYVAISCKWWCTLYGAINVAAIVRGLRKNIKIIAGGHTASVFAEDLLLNSDFDIVIKGYADQPLLRIISEQEPINCLVKQNEEIIKYPVKYVTDSKNSKDIFLEPIHELIYDRNVVPGFIWTGKGCNMHCFYCGENIDAQREIFGMTELFFRPVENVYKDICTLSTMTRNLIFDYETLDDDANYSFYHELFSMLPRGKYTCYFFCWKLPTEEFVELATKTFNYLSICIDVQFFSEESRQNLADKRLIKPLFSNEEFDRILSFCAKKKNLFVDASGILGAPMETDKDVEETRAFIKRFTGKYWNARDFRVSPLHVLPGSTLQKNTTYLDLKVVRNSFKDFYEFNQMTFENNMGYYDKNWDWTHNVHPFGVYNSIYGQHKTFYDWLEVDRVCSDIRKSKISVAVDRSQNETRIDIKDIYCPSLSIFDALRKYIELNDTKSERAVMDLRGISYLYPKIQDHVSESGENVSTVTHNRRLFSDIQNLFKSKGKLVLIVDDPVKLGFLLEYKPHLIIKDANA